MLSGHFLFGGIIIKQDIIFHIEHNKSFPSYEDIQASINDTQCLCEAYDSQGTILCPLHF